MKTKQKLFKFLVVMCIAVTVTSVFAQTTYTWTGAANGTNLDTPGNYTTNGVDPAVTLPNGLDGSGVQESVIWDGRTTTDLNLGKNSIAWPNTGFGTIGVNFVTTTNQTNDVRLVAAAGVTQSGAIGWFSLTNNSPHSSLILGTNWDSGIANLFNLVTRPAGAVHYLVNNSTAPVILDGSIEWGAGGGNSYALDFSGPGDFIANSTLQTIGGGSVSLQVNGPGTLMWTKVGYGAVGSTLSGLSSVNVRSKLIVKTAGNFFPNGVPSTITISNGATLVFDAPSIIDTIDRVITGAGALVLSNGTFTLSGTNAYTGDTTINGGKLVFQGAKPGTGNIAVADGAVLGVYNTNTQVTPGTLTLGNSAGCTLEFNNVTNTKSAIIAAGNLSSAGTVTVNVNSGTFAGGGQYPLLSWASGSTPAINSGVINLGNTNFIGGLVISGTNLLLSVSNKFTTSYTWTGTANGTNLDSPGNYTTNGVDPATTLPSGLDFSGFQESVIWDGRTTSNLNLAKNSVAWPNTGLGTRGVNFVTTSNQTNDVRLAAAAGVTRSGAIGFFGITNNSPHSSLILGTNWDSTVGNVLLLIARPGVSGTVHYLVNNSTAPVIFNGSIEWEAGGGSPYTLDFRGPGDFIANSSLQCDNSAGVVTLQVNGPGTLIWTKVGYGVDGGPSFGVPFGIGLVNVNSKLIVKSAGNFSPASFPSTITVSNGASLVFDAPAKSDTISRVITGAGMLVLSNGTLALAGTNTFSGGTTIVAGTLQIGTNGASGTLGSGNVTNNNTLIFNRAGTLTVSNNVSGTGSVTVLGSGTVVLSGANTYAGGTTISNGTLVANSIGGTVYVAGGTLAQAIDGSIGALTIGGDLNLNAGTVTVALNNSSSPSNTFFQVTGAINYAGGTLKLLNFGPPLNTGDKFTIFNKAVAGGNLITIVSPGFTVNNNLAADGSVTVTGVQSADSNKITPSISGGQVSLSWPSAWTGLHLQVQTNNLGTNWINIPGTDATNSYLTGLMSSNGCVFYRLAP